MITVWLVAFFSYYESGAPKRESEYIRFFGSWHVSGEQQYAVY